MKALLQIQVSFESSIITELQKYLSEKNISRSEYVRVAILKKMKDDEILKEEAV